MDLIEQYRLMHEAGHFPGYSIKQHVDRIAALVSRTGSRTLLDYGCGKGLQYTQDNLHKHWGIMPILYDPGVPGLSEKPVGPFDGVICTDVMEHISEQDVDLVFWDIFGLARKFAFLSICCRPAKKVLPDGRNCHLTVKPREWWLNRIARLNPSVEFEVAWNA